MKLIIDIPEEIKATIDRNGTNEIVNETIWQAVKNGTPLEQEPCDNAINRQAVLEIFGYVMDYWKEHAIDVEPHEIKDALIEQYEFTAKQLSELPPVNPHENAISLEKVIEWLKAKDIIKPFSQEETARKELKALLPVNPQPKTGHWINRHIIANKKIDMIVCSECGEEFSYDAETGISEYNFCPNCGARMIEPQESEESNETNN